MDVGIILSSGIATNKGNFFDIVSETFLVLPTGLMYLAPGKLIMYPDGRQELANSDSNLVGFIQLGDKIVHVYEHYNSICKNIKFGQNLKILKYGLNNQYAVISDRYFCYPGAFNRLYELNGIILHANPIYNCYDCAYRVYTLSDDNQYTCYHISETTSSIVYQRNIEILDQFKDAIVFRVGALNYIVDKKTKFACITTSDVVDLYQNGPNMILEYENNTVCILLGQDEQIMIESPKNRLKSSRF